MQRTLSADRRRRPGRVAAGFTLVEALVSISLAAIAGSVLLLGIDGSLQTTNDALNETIALGMAQQLLDEAMGNKYCDAGTDHSLTLGPDSGESSMNNGRQRFDDSDDFNAYRCQPPADLWGVPLGTDDGLGGQRHVNFQMPTGYFDRWRQEVNVYYVNETDLTQALTGQTSDYRAVEVRIVYADPVKGDRELVKLRRIVTYVPTLP